VDPAPIFSLSQTEGADVRFDRIASKSRAEAEFPLSAKQFIPEMNDFWRCEDCLRRLAGHGACL